MGGSRDTEVVTQWVGQPHGSMSFSHALSLSELWGGSESELGRPLTLSESYVVVHQLERSGDGDGAVGGDGRLQIAVSAK